MPAVLVVLVGAHLAIFRHNGSAGPVVDDPPHAQAGTILAGSDVHGRRVLVDRLHHHRLPRVRGSAVSRRRRPIRRNSSCRIRPGISCRSSACSRSCRRRSISARCRSAPNSSRRSSVPTLFLLVVLLAAVARSQPTPQLRGARAGSCGPRRSSIGGIVALTTSGRSRRWSNRPPRRRHRRNRSCSPRRRPSRPRHARRGAPQRQLARQCDRASGPGAQVFSHELRRVATARKAKAMPGAFPPLGEQSGRHRRSEQSHRHRAQRIARTDHGQRTDLQRQMPPWKGTLTNKQIADVITYIRGSLGDNHAASAVTQAQVARHYKP